MLNRDALMEEIKRGSIHVDNGKKNLGENYIEVTLGDKLKVYDTPSLSVKEPAPARDISIPETGLILKPNELYIGRTQEYTETYGFVPLLAGATELAAVGMEIHVTAGFGDNGFSGTWTLEIVCANPTIVYPGMPIGKLYYAPLIGDASIKYCGKYLGQIEPTVSRMDQEYGDKNPQKVKGRGNC